jgi:hypothetical protein
MKAVTLEIRTMLAVLCLAICAFGKDVSILGDVTIQFVGNSGKLIVYNTKTPNETLEAGFGQITEYQPDGKKVGRTQTNLGPGDFDWTDPQDAVINGYKAKRITTQSNLRGQGLFAITAFIFSEDAKVVHGQTEYSIPKNSLKFSIKIGNWKWDAAGNTLQMTMDYRSSTKKPSNPDVLVKKNAGESVIELGSGTLTIASRALVDGQEVDINPELTRTGPARSVQLHFPHFTDGVDYDPTLAAAPLSPDQGLTGDSTRLLPSLLTVLVCALLRPMLRLL